MEICCIGPIRIAARIRAGPSFAATILAATARFGKVGILCIPGLIASLPVKWRLVAEDIWSGLGGPDQRAVPIVAGPR